MGARLTKPTGSKENRKSFGDRQRSSQGEKQEKGRVVKVNLLQRQKRSCSGIEEDNSNNMRGSAETSGTKRKTLQELHMDPPPGFRKFESEVDWRTIDEEIALQLWEDVFRPLYTF